MAGVPNGSYMQFTDEGSGWTEASIAVALVLGFRPNVSGQDQALAPVGWSGLTAVPDFSPGLLSPVLVVKQAGDDDSKLFSDCVDRRLNADLPEDEKASDTVLEQLAGFEMYQAMKRRQDTCAESRRRVLLVKWLYILGFLSQDFPPVTRFTPPHLRDDDADFE